MGNKKKCIPFFEDRTICVISICVFSWLYNAKIAAVLLKKKIHGIHKIVSDSLDLSKEFYYVALQLRPTADHITEKNGHATQNSATIKREVLSFHFLRKEVFFFD